MSLTAQSAIDYTTQLLATNDCKHFVIKGTSYSENDGVPIIIVTFDIMFEGSSGEIHEYDMECWTLDNGTIYGEW